jgi:hypothetical protein
VAATVGGVILFSRTSNNNAEAALPGPASSADPSSIPSGAPASAAPSAVSARPTPTPTKAPTTKTPARPGSGACPPFPAFPDANCTGWQHTGVTLKVCSEGDGENDGHLRKANVVYSGCIFKGKQSFLRIRAKNITIQRSRIEGAMAPHFETPHDYLGLKLIDVEITTAVENAAPIADGNNYSCLRCHVHHASTGIGGGSNVQITDSYVHDMTYTEGAHQAAVGINSGVGIKIIHNNLDCRRWNVPPGPQGCSSALSLYDEGRLDNVLVQNNLFNAAGEYCAYSGGPTAKNVRFIDNRFGKKYHPRCGNAGPLHSWYPNNTGYVWQNNYFTDGTVARP